MTPGMEDPLPQALAQLLLQAAMAVCPQEVSLLNHKKNGVRRAQSTGQVGDYSTSFARAAFLRMLGTRRQQRRTQQSSGAGAPGEGDAADDEGEDDPAGVVTVRVVTDLGAEVVRHYASAEELAHALAAALSALVPVAHGSQTLALSEAANVPANPLLFPASHAVHGSRPPAPA